MSKFSSYRKGRRCFVRLGEELLIAKVRHVKDHGKLGIKLIVVDTDKLGSFRFDASDGFYLGRRKESDVGQPVLLTIGEGEALLAKAQLANEMASAIAQILRVELAAIGTEVLEESLNHVANALRTLHVSSNT